MGLFSGPPKPKPPRPVIAPPTPFQPAQAQAARPKEATNTSLDSRITAPSSEQRLSMLNRGGGETRKRTLLGGPAG